MLPFQIQASPPAPALQFAYAVKLDVASQEDYLAGARPIVSEAVVDVDQGETQIGLVPKAEHPARWIHAYLIPIVFSAIAFALVAAALLTGANLAILGR